ncbi:hypothetical protein PUN28_003965 [Cardiocondyla obscurior]|uniref:Uncharacterized protein n=1 Tax=Cardiocondyla obscurior TaxID=286306 RepID=A0AAW2GN05_9HYME
MTEIQFNYTPSPTGIVLFCRAGEFNNAPINYCKCQSPSPHYDHVTSYAYLYLIECTIRESRRNIRAPSTR